MYFYDSVLNLHISETPLCISTRVLEASRSLGYSIAWDEEGYVCGLTHDESMGLAAALGSTTLTVHEYMFLASREARIASSEFAEWLKDTYTYEDGTVFDSEHQIVTVPLPESGWFDLGDIREDGLPSKTKNSASPEHWKFWGPRNSGSRLGATRSFIASSGTCSLDISRLVSNRYPKIMIREAYSDPPVETRCGLDRIWANYQSLVSAHSHDDEAVNKFLFDLDETELFVPEELDTMFVERKREMIVDITGKRKILLGSDEGLVTLTYAQLVSSIPASKEDVETIVLGRRRPDADTIVSCVFEAARRNLVAGNLKFGIWTEHLPLEVLHVLGKDFAASLMLQDPKDFSSFILVGCQDCDDAPFRAVQAVVDHHPPTKTYPSTVAQSCETSWSSKLMVYIKLLGSGFELDATTAGILVEATMLETEPDLMTTMSGIDKLALERLKRIATPITPYSALMAILVENEDLEQMFWKDYEEDKFGFAVIKSRHRQPIGFYAIAQANNADKRLPLTIVKHVVYKSDFSRVKREVIVAVFNPSFHDKGFKKAVLDVISHTCIALHGELQVSGIPDTTVVTDSDIETPRRLLMPLLKRLVDEHLRFAFSKSLNRYLACGFFSGTEGKTLYDSPDAVPSITANLNFLDVQTHLQKSKNVSFLTLPEFWSAYKEFAQHRHVASSLTDTSYAELLYTKILQRTDDYSTVLNRNDPRVTVLIPPAEPGHFLPNDCLCVSGVPTHLIPNNLVHPDIANYSGLWQLRSPDADVNVATRGHDFLTHRPSIDLAIKLDEKMKQLTFRPVYRNIPDLKYELVEDGGPWLKLKVWPRRFAIFEDVRENVVEEGHSTVEGMMEKLNLLTG